MKTVIAFILITAAIAYGEDFKTTDGVIYKNATVKGHDAEFLNIVYEDGAASIPFRDLSPEIQKQYNYSEAALIALKEGKARIAEKQRLEFVKQNGFTFTPEEQEGISLKQETYSKILSEVRTRAANLNLDAKQCQEMINAIPPSGRLILTIHRSTIESANTRWFTVLIFDKSGKQISKTQGSDTTAETPDYTKLWWNIMSVDLVDIRQSPFTIRVVDDLQNKAFTFKAE